MTLEVDPDGLRAAAGALALLPGNVDAAPVLASAPIAAKMGGLAAGAALSRSDTVSKKAKDVLKARFNAFAAVLVTSAETYRGTDLDAARKIAALSNLNSGDPHAGGN